MDRFVHVYKFLNHLSVDVSAGAVVCAWFFAGIFGVSVTFHHFAVLGLTVWIIYTADHLLDAKRMTGQASTHRHRFHQRHFTMLLYAATGAALLNTWLIVFLEERIIKAGVVLGICIVAYLLVQRHLFFLKEFFGAVFYTAGIVLSSWIFAYQDMASFYYLPVVHFMVTAWVNLLLFSWFDRHHDEQDRHVSFVTMWGADTTRVVIVFLFALCVVLSVVEFTFRLKLPAAVFLLMDGVLAGMLLFSKYFREHDRFRLLGDIVFFFPLLYLLA